MGYLHIGQLYKTPDIFLFREVYALEKVHGTSAHIRLQGGVIRFFAGGVKHTTFVALFDAPALTERFVSIGHPDMTVFGEAYGGSCQGMKATYGAVLRFVVFDVQVGDVWLSVPKAEQVAHALGLDFVHYEVCATDLADLTRCRDAASVQAVKNGITEAKPREGIVLRPLEEFTTNHGDRVIAKYKGEAFMETATARDIDPSKLTVLHAAQAIADEWVTPMRLTHVLDKCQATEMQHTGAVIRAMVDDITREAGAEVIWSKEATAAIGRTTAQLFKRRITAL
jgi:hypothetical protein